MAESDIINTLIRRSEKAKRRMDRLEVQEIFNFGGMRDAAAYAHASTSKGFIEAITSLGGNDGVIYLSPASYTITANYTVPTNAHLMFANGAYCTVSNGVTLTINGTIEAGVYQIFSLVGTGAVAFGVGSIREVLPDWFGNNATPGTTDMTAEIQAAIESIGSNGGTIRFQSQTYLVSTALSITKHGVDIKGAGMWESKIQTTGAIVGLHLDAAAQNITYWTIEDICIDGNSNTSSHLIHLDGTTNTVRQGIIRNVRLNASGADGIKITENVWSIDIENPYIISSTGDGINAITGLTTTIKVRGGRVNSNAYAFNIRNLNDFVISGVIIEYNSSGGILAYNGQALTIAGCYFEQNFGQIDITLGSGENSQIATVVTGCFINGFCTGANCTHGIFADNADGLLVSGNRFSNHTAAGIWIAANSSEFAVFANNYTEAVPTWILSADGFVETTSDRWVIGRDLIPGGGEHAKSVGDATNPWMVYTPNRIDSVQAKNANYTVDADDFTIIASGVGTTITLPDNPIAGTKYIVKRVDAGNAITVSRQAADTIDGAVSWSLNTNYAVIAVESDGANYHILWTYGTVA